MEAGANKNRPADPPSGVLFAAGRLVGFVLLAGLAMGIFAAVVLVPAYVDMATARYVVGCNEAALQDAQDRVEANRRLIEALPEDPVLVARYAMAQEPLVPQTHEVIRVPGQSLLPDQRSPAANPRPAPPSGLLFQINARLQKPSTKRGLLLLAVALLTAAVFLFSPPNRYRLRAKKSG